MSTSLTAPLPTSTRRPGQGVSWLVLAAVGWGTSGTLGTLLRGASGLPFLAVAGYRIAVGGLLLLAWAVLSGRWRPPRTAAGLRRVGVIGAFSALYQLCFFSSIGDIGVAMATLVAMGAAPLIALTVEALTGRQRITRRLGLTLVAATAGLGLLVGTPPDGQTPDALARGILKALVASAAFAGISLVGARPATGFHHTSGTGLALLLGGGAVLGVAATGAPITFAPSPDSIMLVVGLGLVSSALAYLAYLHGLRTQSASTGSLVSLLEPVTATVLAAVVLGERLTAPGLLGAALLLVAVGLTSFGRRQGPH